MPPSNEQLTITIPLSKFVDSHLGRWIDYNDDDPSTRVHHNYDHRTIDRDIAIIIFTLTDNKHTCYIQWADDMSPDLKEPVLWEYGAWIASSDRWLRQRVQSEKDRAERELFNENLKIVTKAVIGFLSVEEEQARLIAYKMLRDGRVGPLKAIGVTKLADGKEI